MIDEFKMCLCVVDGDNGCCPGGDSKGRRARETRANKSKLYRFYQPQKLFIFSSAYFQEADFPLLQNAILSLKLTRQIREPIEIKLPLP